MEIISTDELVSYLPGVSIPAGSAQLYVSLTNDEVTGALRLPDGKQPPPGAKRIALEVAARAARSADGYSSVTTSFDDTSKTVRREGAAGAKRLGVYLTDEERAELVGLAGRRPKKARSIRLMVP